uniref:Uncharacterized protein n=1 Tax=Anguilla anguilla TaxID=7936 RepID=A0A0E9TPU9_ANGAN
MKGSGDYRKHKICEKQLTKNIFLHYCLDLITIYMKKSPVPIKR